MTERVERSGDVIRKASKATMLLQGFAALLLIMLGMLLYEISSRYASLQDGIRENSLWSVFQLDRETRQLNEVIAETRRHPETWPGNVGAMLQRFDILYSRMTILEQASFEQSFSGNIQILSRIEHVRQGVEALTPFFDRLAAGQVPAFDTLETVSASARAMSRQTEDLLTFANSAVSSARADAREGLMDIQIKTGGVIALLVGCVLFLIFSLRRQLRSVREAGLRLETMATALNAAYLDAQAGNSAKSQFLATIGHEVRTPLNAILGTAELMELSALPDDIRPSVQTIRRSGQSLLEIINEILDFAKIENGKLVVEQHPLNVLSVACDVVDMIRDRAAENGNTVRFLAPQTLSAPWILSDPTRLRQVLLNLLSNATKFTRNGTVTLEIREFHENDHLWLGARISDTGIGIDSDGLTKLFQPFSQVDASITRRFGGTGLGLTICKEIVETLGGRIGVESMKSEGSTFWFELPVTATEPPDNQLTDSATMPVAVQRLKPMEVLLVEDNRVNQDVALRYLAHLGHRVTLANDGNEAVGLTADRSFDLILMDMHMPHMDGIAATRRIRDAELRTGRRTPIIAMTANASDHDRNLCAEAGMDGFQSKPISLKALQTIFSRFGTPDSENAAEAVPLSFAVAGEGIDAGFAARRAEMIAVLGEDDFAELLSSFFLDAEGLIAQLQRPDTLDTGMRDRLLHTIKGAASSVGLQMVSDRCERLRQGDVFQSDIDNVENEIRNLRQRLAA